MWQLKSGIRESENSCNPNKFQRPPIDRTSSQPVAPPRQSTQTVTCTMPREFIEAAPASPTSEGKLKAKLNPKLDLLAAVKEKTRSPTARMGPTPGAPSTRRERPETPTGGKNKKSKAEKSPEPGSKSPGKAKTKAKAEQSSPVTGQDASAAAPKQPKLKKEAEFYPEELLNRGPISPRILEHLAKKCGPPIQENCVNVRVDSKRPPGRLEETMASRHERCPPATVVLMFNCFEAGFELEYGDIGTMPEAEAVEIRSIRSQAVLGVVHILPTKHAPLQERIVFKVREP